MQRSPSIIAVKSLCMSWSPMSACLENQGWTSMQSLFDFQYAYCLLSLLVYMCFLCISKKKEMDKKKKTGPLCAQLHKPLNADLEIPCHSLITCVCLFSQFSLTFFSSFKSLRDSGMKAKGTTFFRRRAAQRGVCESSRLSARTTDAKLFWSDRTSQLDSDNRWVESRGTMHLIVCIVLLKWHRITYYRFASWRCVQCQRTGFKIESVVDVQIW